MKISFDGKELEVEQFTLYDLTQLEEKGVSVSKIAADSERGINPSAKDLSIILSYVIRKADPSYTNDEEIAKKIGFKDSLMTDIISAILPGGKSEVPFPEKS